MTRRRNSQSILDRALAIAYPDPEERESARRAFLRKKPHERDEIRRLLAEAFGGQSNQSTVPARSVANNARSGLFDEPSREQSHVSTARSRASGRADSLVAGAPRPAWNVGSAASPISNHRQAMLHSVRDGANKRRGRL